jgi:hypothetical protein
MDVFEAKRLKQFEDENARLRKLLAAAMLDTAARGGSATTPASCAVV